MAITDWPESERPREKLLAQGAAVLSDAELLAIFLRTGMKGVSAVDMARDLLMRYGGLRPLLESSQESFCEAPGLGPAKFAQLQAVLEMSRRHLLATLQRGDLMESPQAVRQYLLAQMRHHQQEVFACLFMDNKHRVIRFEPMFFGTIDAASVYPREVVKKALSLNAAAVILAHNHPSGIAEPSLADKQITRRLVDALQLVDIRVLDHMIVGDPDVISFAEQGLL
jgi:DNA repair protein RadC